jgi:hypothetical protein
LRVRQRREYQKKKHADNDATGDGFLVSHNKSP